MCPAASHMHGRRHRRGNVNVEWWATAVMACRGRVVVGSEEAVEAVGTREKGGCYDRGRSWLLAYRGSGGVLQLRDVGWVERETTR